MTTALPLFQPGPSPIPILKAPQVRAKKASIWTPQASYQHPDLDDDPEEDRHAESDVRLAVRVGEFLQFHFPGHPFLVQVEHQSGVIMLSLPPLTGPRDKWIIHIHKLDPGWTKIKRYAGEILERFRLSRNRYDHSEFRAAVARRPIWMTRRGKVPE